MDGLKDNMMVLFRMNKLVGPKECMGSCVAGLGAGLSVETLGGRG